MKMSIRSRGMTLTRALATKVRRRFSGALRHGARRLSEVSVRFEDLNGPRGGAADKLCFVELRFTDGGAVRIRERQGDLYAAIGRAADRTKRALLEHLRARRTHRRDAR